MQNDKIKILFVITSLRIGGVEKAMLGLLNTLSPLQFDITLGVISPEGGYINDVPKYVKIVCIKSLTKYQNLFNAPVRTALKAFKAGRFVDAFTALAVYLKAKLRGSLHGFYNHYLSKEEPDFDTSFDIAVSFHGPSELIDFYVTSKIDSTVKYGWIHFDLSKVHYKAKSSLLSYGKFDRIFIVSKAAKDVFDSIFPQFASKSFVFNNIVDQKSILELASEEEIPQTNKLRIATVGRMHPAKGQDIAIRAAAILKKHNIDFSWNFVGDGIALASNRELARELSVESFINFLGAKHNPYPYMANCDIYVQPSRHEGFCITIAEAMIFGMPIVATNFSGALEQLYSVPNAIVVETFDADSLANAIIKATALPHRGKINDKIALSKPPIYLLTETFYKKTD